MKASAALLMRDPAGAGLRYVREVGFDLIAEPRAAYGDSPARKVAREDADLFDRLGIPIPADGSRREGLIEALMRAASERKRAFEAAGGVVGASLLHVPVPWERASSEWECPDAWLMREPWVDWSLGGAALGVVGEG